MRPLFIGYTNPTQETDAGDPQRRQKVDLTFQDLVTHVHGVGATRSGKSKWLEWFCRQLYQEGAGFTVIDPQGALAKALVSYFAYIRPRRPVIYFDPSRTDYLVPFNAFRSGYDEVSKRVAKQVEALLRVWNVENSDETPRLERWLRCIFHLFATGLISLNEVSYLLTWTHVAIREHAVQALKDNPMIQNEWLELLAYKKPQDFAAQIESARNRLFRFAEPRQIRRIMSIEERSLDFGAIFEQGAILIVNLQESRSFSEENARLIGTLMINELWAAARSRPKPPKAPYFLLIDEVPRFLTPDIKDILDRGAGKGLHLGVFHQHLTQFKAQDPWTFESVMTNAKVKLVFGGLTKEDALLMVDEIFANQIQYDEVKFTIEQTKFWPVYGRDTVSMSSRGGARGSATSTLAGVSAGQAITTFPDTDGFYNIPGPITDTTGASQAEGRSQSEAAMWSDGEADIPIFYPVPFKEVSSIETYTLEEQRNRLADCLKEQYQRHYFVKRPGQKTVAAVTPFVKEFRIFPKREEAYVLEHLIKPYALPVEGIDQQLQDRLKKLEREAKQGAKRLPEFKTRE